MAAPSKSRLGRGLGGLIAAAKPAPPPPATAELRTSPPISPAPASGLAGYQEMFVLAAIVTLIAGALAFFIKGVR